MQPERDSEGEWTDPPEVIRQKHADYNAARRAQALPSPADPEGWC
jgi:hypothetical protein